MTLIKKASLVAVFIAAAAYLLWGFGDDADRIAIVLFVWAAAAVPAGLAFGECLRELEDDDPV